VRGAKIWLSQLRGENITCRLSYGTEAPLKRRIGIRYSNEFYFVTPATLVTTAEVPAECGLLIVTATINWPRTEA
jgi:hypothetical protein